MTTKTKKTTFIFLVFLSILLTFFFYWLFSFVIDDMRDVSGPRLSQYENKYVDSRLESQRKSLVNSKQLTERKINNYKRQQNIISSNINSFDSTIRQLSNIKQNIIKQNENEYEKIEIINNSLQMFLESQRKYLEHNQKIHDLLAQKYSLQNKIENIDRKLDDQRDTARQEYSKAQAKHKFYVAVMKISFCLLLIAVATFSLYKKRKSNYNFIFISLFLAACIISYQVMHSIFPNEVFKYVMIVSLIAVLISLIIYVVKINIQPSLHKLQKKYREAYEKFVCPNCGFPIRMGPLMFLPWMKSFIKNNSISNYEGKLVPYVCPNCNTNVFEKCNFCGDICFSLLPGCQSCGNEKNIF